MPIFSPTYFDPTIFDTGGSGGITGTGAGTLPLGGSGSGSAEVRGAGAGILPLAGSGVGAVTGGGGAPAPLVFRDYLWVDIASNPDTFAAMAIGVADADRWVIAAVLINHNASRQVTAVTIGGVSAVELYEAPTLAAEGITMSFWKANVPTGATADVIVTCDALWYDGAVATYSCIGEPALFDSAHDATYTGTTFSVAVDVDDGGAVIGLARNDGAGTLSAWVGATADETDETHRVYVASLDELTAETGRTVSFTTTAASGVSGFYGLAVVSLSIPATGGSGDVAGVGAGALPLAGSGAGQARVAGAGAGTLPLAGSGAGVAPVAGQGAGSLPLAGSGAGQARVAGAGAGTLPLAGSGSGVAPVAGQGAGSLPLAGSGAGVIGNSITGAGAGTLPLTGSGTGRADARGVGAGSLPLAGSGVGAARAAGQGVGALPLSGGGQGRAEAQGQGAGTLPLAGTGIGGARVAGAGAGALPLSGSGAGVAPVAGTGSGVLPLAGAGAGVLGSFADYSTGRLAFASKTPRHGLILNATRRGEVLNTTPRRGEILNKALRKGEILNPVRRGRIVELEE